MGLAGELRPPRHLASRSLKRKDFERLPAWRAHRPHVTQHLQANLGAAIWFTLRERGALRRPALSERGYISRYSRSPSAAPSTRTSLLTELGMKQASCAR